MAKLLTQLQIPSPAKRSEAFHHVMVNHFPYIREKSLFQQTPVNDVWCRVYRGDFNGLLQHLNVRPGDYRANVEFNGFLSTNDYDGSPILVSVINADFIDTLFNNFITVKR